MLSSRTWPWPEVEEEEHKNNFPFRSLYSLNHEVTGYQISLSSVRAPLQGCAPSPYIGERVAYKGRNPNGIFDELSYFIKLLWPPVMPVLSLIRG